MERITINKPFDYNEYSDFKCDLADAFAAVNRCTVDVLTPDERDCVSRCLAELNRRLNDDGDAWLEIGSKNDGV
jgi:hypothetical protein